MKKKLRRDVETLYRSTGADVILMVNSPGGHLTSIVTSDALDKYNWLPGGEEYAIAVFHAVHDRRAKERAAETIVVAPAPAPATMPVLHAPAPAATAGTLPVPQGDDDEVPEEDVREKVDAMEEGDGAKVSSDEEEEESSVVSSSDDDDDEDD
jgi:hypothetical protein